jgi:hypothetical protein
MVYLLERKFWTKNPHWELCGNPFGIAGHTLEEATERVKRFNEESNQDIVEYRAARYVRAWDEEKQ